VIEREVSHDPLQEFVLFFELARSLRLGRHHPLGYFLFRAQYVAWLFPPFPQSSLTGVPSSPCRMIRAFWTSDNFGDPMDFHSLQPRQ
jgi:hypothetical protein